MNNNCHVSGNDLLSFVFTATVITQYVWNQDNVAASISWIPLGNSHNRAHHYICEYDDVCSRSNVVCYVYGKCLHNTATASQQCFCDTGFTGDNCSTEINECESDPCQNNATCIDGIATYTCHCVAGFTETNCETDIDECMSNPCQNGACIDHVNAYSCNCIDTGFTGLNCETEIDECASDPCVNGICMDYVNSYLCNCTNSGFFGSLCEDDIDECANETICGFANCTNTPGDYFCDCPDGFHGYNCLYDVDECTLNDDVHVCNSHGDCNNTLGSFNCNCYDAYTGVTCETPLGPFVKSPNDDDDNTSTLLAVLYAGIALSALLAIPIAGFLVAEFRYKRKKNAA